VLVTGAAGNIGYSIIPLICNGTFLGPNQTVILHLLDIPFCADKLNGVKLEVEDCAFPLVKGIVSTVDVKEAFTDLDYAFLVGSFPRRDGMERKELLEKNAAIFKAQGSALNEFSKKTVKVLVVGNPANTNALIAMSCAPSLPKENFSAMTRLDHNRALGFLAAKAGTAVSDISNVIIWGNHSSTQYPDVSHAIIAGAKATEKITDSNWLQTEFITSVQKRGAAIIKARGLSSAASAAVAAVDHMRDWALGTPAGKFVSMAVPSDGSYGIAEGVIYSFPVTTSNGSYKIVQGLEISDFSRKLMDATHKELQEERAEAFAFLGL
jgi:NAD-dependent malate dehydrogenase